MTTNPNTKQNDRLHRANDEIKHLRDQVRDLERERDATRKWSAAWKALARDWRRISHVDAESVTHAIRSREAAERERDEARRELEKLRQKRFPLQDGPSIPWDVIAPHERQAQRNHDQSLERLAQRGGLSCAEFWFVMNDSEFRYWAGDPALKLVTEQGHKLALKAASRSDEIARLRQVLQGIQDMALVDINEAEEGPMTHQIEANARAALVRLVEAGKVLLTYHQTADDRVRFGLAVEAAQAQLRQLIQEVDSATSAQILIALEGALGPAGDVNAN